MALMQSIDCGQFIVIWDTPISDAFDTEQEANAAAEEYSKNGETYIVCQIKSKYPAWKKFSTPARKGEGA